MNTLYTRIILRNDETVNWSANDSTILLRGEVGLEFLANGSVKMKIGNGTSTWAELDYFGGKENNVFETTKASNESVEEAISRVVGDVTLNKADIAIVKEVIAVDTENDDNSVYSYTAYVYNGTAWAAMQGNYNAKNIYFDQNLMVTKEIGYITLTNGQGTVPSMGKNLIETWESIMVKEQNPTKTDPSVSVTLTGAGSYEVGTEVTPSFTASFDDGKYTYGPEPTGAEVTAWEVTSTSGETFDTNSGTCNAITVTDTTNYSVTAKATHTAGDVPVTNKQNLYPSAQIESGSKTKKSSAITGYRSFFYGVLDTSSVDEPLTSAIVREKLTNAGNYNESKSFTLNGSATAKRLVVLVPSNNTGGGIDSVILTSAMNTPITDSYVKTTSALKVEGVNGATAVDYDAYVYEPATIDAGEVHAITLK